MIFQQKRQNSIYLYWGMHLTQPNMLQIFYNTPVVADFKENEITVATASCSTG